MAFSFWFVHAGSGGVFFFRVCGRKRCADSVANSTNRRLSCSSCFCPLMLSLSLPLCLHPQSPLGGGRDVNGQSPIFHAAMEGHIRCLEALLKAGGPADACASDAWGRTPLFHVASEEPRVWVSPKLPPSRFYP